jgi:TRAP-type C4-dicarboxylate transport system permease small subunit
MNEVPESSNNRVGVAGWIAIIVLLGFLAGAIAYAVHAWTAMSGVDISPLGWLFMALGVFFTIAVGGGLMALVFYSSRHDYDQ